LKAAGKTWIPIEDLVAFLNGMPGPNLTKTDVAQRLRAFQDEPYADRYPNERVKDACLPTDASVVGPGQDGVGCSDDIELGSGLCSLQNEDRTSFWRKKK
jgi:hypothetical protein